MTDDKELFAAVRKIKGKALVQTDVDLFNKALGRAVIATKSGMKASAAGIALIHSFETLELETYPDPGSKDGKPVTGGWGSTRDHNNQPFKLGFSADKAYWDALFARDLVTTEAGVNLLLNGAPTTQAQFDALVSFAYNVGLDIDEDTKAEGLGDSSLLRFHLKGQYASAKAAFAAWKYNDGVVMKGLIRRRAAEAALYAS